MNNGKLLQAKDTFTPEYLSIWNVQEMHIANGTVGIDESVAAQGW